MDVMARAWRRRRPCQQDREGWTAPVGIKRAEREVGGGEWGGRVLMRHLDILYFNLFFLLVTFDASSGLLTDELCDQFTFCEMWRRYRAAHTGGKAFIPTVCYVDHDNLLNPSQNHKVKRGGGAFVVDCGENMTGWIRRTEHQSPFVSASISLSTYLHLSALSHSIMDDQLPLRPPTSSLPFHPSIPTCVSFSWFHIYYNLSPPFPPILFLWVFLLSFFHRPSLKKKQGREPIPHPALTLSTSAPYFTSSFSLSPTYLLFSLSSLTPICFSADMWFQM